MPLFLFVALTHMPAQPHKKRKLSLNDCYALALGQSEELKIQNADIKIAQARYRQALASYYPTLALTAQAMRQGPQASGGPGSS